MNRRNILLSSLFPSVDCNEKFIDSQINKIAFQLCPENFGRALVLTEFLVCIKEFFPKNSLIRVAVVGGYKTEPEIKALLHLGYSLQVQIYGIEEDMIRLDLNDMPQNLSLAKGNFDLVLCSQVWEHIWSHEAALMNLTSLMSKQSYLWLAAPASNRFHGSPQYFSAGFTSQYLTNNLSRVGLEVHSHGQLGTRRNYLATHTLPTWLSVKGHQFPLFLAFSEHKFAPRVLFSFRYLIKTFGLLLTSKKITTSSRFATESWAFARMSEISK